MRIRLDSRWVRRLLEQPESGMGYQRVRVRLRSGRVIEQAVVHNAEILEIQDDHEAFAAADIAQIDVAPGTRP